MIDITAHQLGETNELINIDLRDDLKQLILSMSQQTTKQILIFSHDLDSHLFDHEALYEAIKLLAIKNHRTHIHIIVQDPRPIVSRGHTLLRLAHRLTSHMQIKVTAKEHVDILKTFIIFDDEGYIIQDNPERFEASGNFYDPLKARKLSEQFEELWNRGMVDSSLRRLSL